MRKTLIGVVGLLLLSGCFADPTGSGEQGNRADGGTVRESSSSNPDTSWIPDLLHMRGGKCGPDRGWCSYEYYCCLASGAQVRCHVDQWQGYCVRKSTPVQYNCRSDYDCHPRDYGWYPGRCVMSPKVQALNCVRKECEKDADCRDGKTNCVSERDTLGNLHRVCR